MLNIYTYIYIYKEAKCLLPSKDSLNDVNSWHNESLNFYTVHGLTKEYNKTLSCGNDSNGFLTTLQIVQLTASGDFEEALALCKMLPPEDASLRAAKEGSIHIR